MLEMLGYIAARVIAGVITALILAAIFNAQCNRAMQAAGARLPSARRLPCSTVMSSFSIRRRILRGSPMRHSLSPCSSGSNSDLIPLLMAEVALAVLIFAGFFWWERRNASKQTVQVGELERMYSAEPIPWPR